MTAPESLDEARVLLARAGIEPSDAHAAAIAPFLALPGPARPRRETEPQLKQVAERWPNG